VPIQATAARSRLLHSLFAGKQRQTVALGQYRMRFTPLNRQHHTKRIRSDLSAHCLIRHLGPTPDDGMGCGQICDNSVV